MSSFMDHVTEAMGWTRIMLSPTIGCGLIGGYIYLNYPGLSGTVTALLIVLSGLLTGAIWASRIAKRKGTMRFLAQSKFLPETDDPDVYLHDYHISTNG